MSILFNGAKHQFRTGVSHAQVGVNIDELARDLARDMEAKKAEMIRQQREESSAPRVGDPDVHCLATRFRDGSWALESTESFGKIGELKAKGATIEIALANIQYEFCKRLLALKAAKDLGDACDRVSKINFHVHDISVKKTMVGAGD
jgi:hypothetical protein